MFALEFALVGIRVVGIRVGWHSRWLAFALGIRAAIRAGVHVGVRSMVYNRRKDNDDNSLIIYLTNETVLFFICE